MPEARVFRRAGRGKSASPVRRGESEARPGCHSLSYSTGSVWQVSVRILAIGGHLGKSPTERSAAAA